MSVSDFEETLGLERSYTIEVLQALEKTTGEHYGILIGADSLLSLHTWHRAPELAEKYEFLTYPRAGAEVTREKLLEHWPEKTAEKLRKSVLDGTFFEISSTESKKRMEKNRFRRHIISVDGIPECVLEYIAAHGLYQVSGSGKG